MCDLETSITRQPGPELICSATETVGGTNNSMGGFVPLDPNKGTKQKNWKGGDDICDVSYRMYIIWLNN